MSKTLVVRDEVFEYPDVGDSNYGEEATGWAEEVTDVLTNVSGPGDIATTELTLSGTDTGTHIEGTITGMLFDTAFVQSIEVTGHITRTYTDATPDQVERFSIEGAYNGTDLNFTVTYSGDCTELSFDNSGGQFLFSYLKLHPDQVTSPPTNTTELVKIKFSGKSLINEGFFE